MTRISRIPRSIVRGPVAVVCVIAAAAVSAAQPGAARAATPGPAAYRVVVRYLRIRMEDGVRLSAKVAFPSVDGLRPTARRFGVVLTMTPYDKDGANDGYAPNIEYFAERGFVRAVVDVRGTGASEGPRSMTWSPREQLDAAEVIQWLGAQSFSNGRVAMFGGSYLGIIQYFAAALAPSHLKAIVPIAAFGDLYRDVIYQGGILTVLGGAEIAAGLGLVATLPSHAPSDLGPVYAAARYVPPVGCGLHQAPASSVALAQGILAASTDAVFYRQASPFWFAGCIKIPALIVDGWFDWFERGAIEMYDKLSRRHGVETRLWIDDTSHYPGSALAYRPTTSDAHTDNPLIASTVLGFLHRKLDTRRSGVDAAHLLIMGSGGKYLQTTAWPPHEARFARLQLGPGTLTNAAPPGQASYVTNPLAGFTNTLSRQSNGATITPYAPLDQRLEGNDGLVWRTAPFTRPYTIAGTLSLHLVASSSAPDTDWIVRVSDLAPDGRGCLLTEGWLRASHRALDPGLSRADRPFHTHTSPTPITPGRIYDYEIEILPTANQFGIGHRLQLQVASNDTPNHLPGTLQIDLNHASGIIVRPNLPAINTVLYGGADPSTLLLPVIRR